MQGNPPASRIHTDRLKWLRRETFSGGMCPTSLALFLKSSLRVVFTQPPALVLSYIMTINRSMAANIRESIVRGINGLLMTSKKASMTLGYTSHASEVVSAMALLCPKVPAYMHAVNRQVLKVFARAKRDADLQLGQEQQ